MKQKIVPTISGIVMCLAVYTTLDQLLYRRWIGKSLRKRQRSPYKVTGNQTLELQKGKLTLVTAYFNIGTLPFKGFDKEQYITWARAYTYVANPLVVFSDDDDFIQSMLKTRNKFPNITAIKKIDKNSVWPFPFLNEIKKVFSQPNYPKHLPNTVMPEYSAVQHAKYALVANAIRSNILPNDIYAWIDVGYFRHLLYDSKYFELLAPFDLNRTKIAFNKVYEKDTQLTPDDIFKGNKVWIGGGMFIGTNTLLLQFEVLYKRAFRYFLDQKLMNTDQQVLYSIYSEKGRLALKPHIEVQTYTPRNFKGDPWFYLGYIMRNFMPE